MANRCIVFVLGKVLDRWGLGCGFVKNGVKLNHTRKGRGGG